MKDGKNEKIIVFNHYKIIIINLEIFENLIFVIEIKHDE